MNWNLNVYEWFLSLKISINLWTLKYFIFLILSLLGLTQDDNYSPSASSSSRPSHQGVKRKYKSNNGDNVKTSYPKKEPKIEPEISLEHPDEHAIGQDEDIGEDYGDYGDYEAGPSGEGRQKFFFQQCSK